MNATALLVFGVIIPEEKMSEMPWANPDGWPDDQFKTWLAKLAGHVRPTTPYDTSREAHHAYWEARRQAVTACPVELRAVGYAGRPSYMLILKSATQHAAYDPATLPRQFWQHLAEPLIAFCRDNQIPLAPPNWHLVACYG